MCNLNDLIKTIVFAKTTHNRLFAAKPPRDILLIKLLAATLAMPEMEKACWPSLKSLALKNEILYMTV